MNANCIRVFIYFYTQNVTKQHYLCASVPCFTTF
ncbi:MAG: hypothetical protein RIQ47_1200, partial [Bacteroidota bacterium]